VLVEPLAVEYRDAALDMVGSTRLDVDTFAILDMPYKLIFPGDGRAGCFLSKSLSLCMPMLFGLEKSFIFDFSLAGFASFSGTGGGLSNIPGEYCGLRGKTDPVAAAKLCPPMNPSMFR
jgi:hypothetical protein